MTNISSGLAEVDGAKLYYEVRGRGPALLMISGAGGDGGYYSQAAAILEDSFTVITYDRRGNSRSTGRNDAPISITEQARDAKALTREALAAMYTKENQFMVADRSDRVLTENGRAYLAQATPIVSS